MARFHKQKPIIRQLLTHRLNLPMKNSHISYTQRSSTRIISAQLDLQAPMSQTNKITGVLLAGGQARRMGGGDKCLLPLNGKTLLQHAVKRARPQVEPLLLSANGNKLRFARSKLEVISDNFTDYPGPLAGLHAAMRWMLEHKTKSPWLASFASDTPFFPLDVVERLQAAAEEHESQIVVVTSHHRVQPVFALWNNALVDEIEATLESGHIPKLQDWIKNHRTTFVEFDDTEYDAFFNINYPQDLYKAQDLISQVEQNTQ